MMHCTFLDSPIGPLLLVGSGGVLTRVALPAGGAPAQPEPGWTVDASSFPGARRQLGEYFAGHRREFTLDLLPAGTRFQLAVWQELRRIPYGTTISYGELARRVGKPTASRAVGAANGRNPLPIVVPCHRVIGADGKLVGFGGGLPVKEALLRLERGEREQFSPGDTFPPGRTVPPATA